MRRNYFLLETWHTYPLEGLVSYVDVATYQSGGLSGHHRASSGPNLGGREGWLGWVEASFLPV